MHATELVNSVGLDDYKTAGWEIAAAAFAGFLGYIVFKEFPKE